jgi:hypothetical protein
MTAPYYTNESLDGLVHCIRMLLPKTVVVGATGAAGIVAIKMLIGTEALLKPTELRAYTLN